tara:strand:- start:650 stop:1009 length:360 start_codon:yes stop_codon:yes gene_type:complete
VVVVVAATVVVATGAVVVVDGAAVVVVVVAGTVPADVSARTGTTVVAGDADTGYRTGLTEGSATRAAMITTTPMTPRVIRALRIRRTTGTALHRGTLDPRHPNVVSDTVPHMVWIVTVV